MNLHEFKTALSVRVENAKVSSSSQSLILSFIFTTPPVFVVLVFTFFIQEAAKAKLDKENIELTDPMPKEDMVNPIGQKVQSTLDAYVTSKRERKRGEGNEIREVQETNR